MSAPSTNKIHASSSKVVRNTKRDVNASRVFGASSVSSSSRKVNGAGGSSGTQSARVYLDGADVTPQSLLVSRIKPSTAQGQRSSGGATGKGRSGTTTNSMSRRSRNMHGGSSVIGASMILSNSSVSSLDDSSDTDVPSSTPSTGGTKSAGASAKVSSAAKASSVSPALVVPSPAPTSGNNPNGDATTTGVADTSDTAASSATLNGDAKQASANTAATSAPTSSASVATATTATTTIAATARRRPVMIELTETSTMFVFELRSVCVSAELSQFHQAVAARNRAYLDVCAAKRGSDKFVDGRSQTLQLAQKGKEVMTAPPATRDAMCVATDWDIFDCARIEEENQNEHDDSSSSLLDTAASAAASAPATAVATSIGSSGTAATLAVTTKSARALSEIEHSELQLKRQVDEIVDATLVSPGCVLDVDGDIVDDLRARQHARTRRTKQHGNSQRSRTHHTSGSTQSQRDLGRSGSSMASVTQSSATLSFGASQDVVTTNSGTGASRGAVGDSSSNNQVNASTVSSRGTVLSGDSSTGSGGGGASGDDSNKQNAYARANANVDIGETIAQQRTAKVLSSQSLLETVSIVERAVQQNVYHAQHVLYRNFPSLTDAQPAAAAASGVADSAFALEDNRMHPDSDWHALSGGGRGGGDDDDNMDVHFASGYSTNGTNTRSSRSNNSNKCGGTLEKLWAFQCALSAGRRVTCLAWNTVNEDLLAVSYGRVEASALTSSVATHSSVAVDTAGVDDGLILFWSLKNPEFPERIYNLSVGVTSIDFSHAQPFLLAVGFINGVVAIYDTRKDDATHAHSSSSSSSSRSGSIGAGASGLLPAVTAPRAQAAAAPLSAPPPGGQLPDAAAPTPPQRLHTPVPVATSDVSPGKHLDVLWQVKWISKGSDRSENVVSIASDGRVTEWSMKKGLSYSDLMTLKRVANPLLGSDARADGVISRQASGHCLDFVPNDPSVYYVGTEDGLIHKCSVSYNEQYLETYYGHTGPVYQLVVSPFHNDVFLSCAGDWNVKLWHASEPRDALLTCRSVDLAHAVHGISWCPRDATLFGAVAEDGRIEIWDLAQSTLDPILTHFPTKVVVVMAAVTPTASGTSHLDTSEEALGTASDSVATTPLVHEQPQTIFLPLECTTIAFAPSAPVIVVGDSLGDVTIYRVPTLAARASESLSHDEQVAKLLRAMYPNKHK